MATTDLTRGIYRRLYGGMRTGRRINSVSVDAALLFWHLHTIADDFGNLVGDPDLVRTEAAPRRREWDDSKMEVMLAELAGTCPPLISTYQHNGSRYIHIADFETNQPAGKNGRRIQKFPMESGGIQENHANIRGIQQSGESGGILVNPDYPGKSCPPIPIPIPIPNKEGVSISDPPEGKPEMEFPPPLDDPDFRHAWGEWEQHRREIKKKLTPLAIKKQLRELAGWGLDRAIAAIDFTISKGWTGLREPDETPEDGIEYLSPEEIERRIHTLMPNDDGSSPAIIARLNRHA